jgi:hypothetical protein
MSIAPADRRRSISLRSPISIGGAVSGFTVCVASAPPQEDDHDHQHRDPKGDQDPDPRRDTAPEFEVAGVICTVALTFAKAQRVTDTFDGAWGPLSSRSWRSS